MNDRQATVLKKELEVAGASTAEADDLIVLAKQLTTLKETDHKDMPLLVTLVRSLCYSMVPIGCFMAGVLTITLSQAGEPDSPFFPIQEISDRMAVQLSPNYRGEVMMKRAQQVRYLVTEHASQAKILAALNDYQIEAATYAFTPHNYDVYSFCKSNLSQAAAGANGDTKQAILHTLNVLENA